jgi:hypothetical protein
MRWHNIISLENQAVNYKGGNMQRMMFAVMGLVFTGLVLAQDSLNCRQLGWCDTPDEACKINAIDNYAYVADYRSGLRIISVAEPDSPVEVGYYDTPGVTNGVAAIGDLAYLADGNYGLRIVEFYGMGIAEREKKTKGINRLMPTVIASRLKWNGTNYRAELLDCSGRRVLELKPGDNDLQRLAPGVYFVKESGDGSVTKVIVQH